MLIWAAEVLGDGGEPHDSGDEVSIASREGGEVNKAAAVIGPDSTAEDTGTAIVEVDAAVGVLDVYNTDIEAVEPAAKNKVATRKTFSHWNKSAPRINCPMTTMPGSKFDFHRSHRLYVALAKI